MNLIGKLAAVDGSPGKTPGDIPYVELITKVTDLVNVTSLVVNDKYLISYSRAVQIDKGDIFGDRFSVQKMQEYNEMLANSIEKNTEIKRHVEEFLKTHKE